MIAVAAGMSLPATWEPVASPLALDAFVVHPWNHRSPHLPSLATGEPLYATSPPASTTEPPAAVANALEGPDHHLDPRIMIAVARGSLSPPQLDTSTATEAHSELTAGRSIAAGETGEHPPRWPPVHEPGAREPQTEKRGVDVAHRKKTRSTVDRRIRPPWTVNRGLRPVEAHGRDVAAPQHAKCLARPGPDRPNPKTV